VKRSAESAACNALRDTGNDTNHVHVGLERDDRLLWRHAAALGRAAKARVIAAGKWRRVSHHQHRHTNVTITTTTTTTKSLGAESAIAHASSP
jgi:hypothetical protein